MTELEQLREKVANLQKELAEMRERVVKLEFTVATWPRASGIVPFMPGQPGVGGAPQRTWPQAPTIWCGNGDGAGG